MPRSRRVRQRRADDKGEAIPAERKGDVCERHFWPFVLAIVFVLVLTRTFDFTLVPPEYRGMQITRPFCGLHGEYEAACAWAGRSHVKHGLGYTKGYATLVVGDPPPLLPHRYVSHPPLESWVSALAVWLFGARDWSLRVFDLILSIPCLMAVLVLLRRLYGSDCALLSGLLLVLLPLPASLGFGPLVVLCALWALYRYVQLTGRREARPGARSRRLAELVVALFLIVQLTWIGSFYALAIGLHYVLTCLSGRRVQWGLLGVLVVATTSSIALNLHTVVHGLRHNLAVEAPYEGPGAPAPEGRDTLWSRVQSLYEWPSGDGKAASFSWLAWLAQNLRRGANNFSAPVLVFSVVYLLYLLAAHVRVCTLEYLDRPKEGSDGRLLKTPRDFVHMWFFLLPGSVFLLAFRGPSWAHPYWQSPLALFLAISTASGVLLVGDVFARIHPRFGRAVVGALVLVLAGFCNQELTESRVIREQSPRTLGLFQRLSKEIPPDKALLTFRDFTIRGYEGKIEIYQPEYAWYLDREMVSANAWQYEPGYWALSVQVDDVVAQTVKEVQVQAQTGLFWYYLIPAREEYGRDPLAEELRRQQVTQMLPNVGLMRSFDQILQDAPCGPQESRSRGVMSLTMEELDRQLDGSDSRDRGVLYWEKHRRYREAVIARLKDLYHCEYCDNRARPGDEDFCYHGNTPCYLFDLLRPK